MMGQGIRSFRLLRIWIDFRNAMQTEAQQVDQPLTFKKRIGKYVSLSFSESELEESFKEQYQQDIHKQVRHAIIIGSVLYGVFFFMDVLMVGELPSGSIGLVPFLIIRLVVVFAGIGMYFFLRTPDRVLETCFAAVMIASLGLFGCILYATLTLPEEYAVLSRAYYPGLMLVIIYGQIAMRLRFKDAMYSALSVVLLLLFPLYLQYSPYTLNFYVQLIAATIVGGFGNYWIERYSREHFIKDRTKGQTLDQLKTQLARKTRQNCEEFRAHFIQAIDRCLEEKPRSMTIKLIIKDYLDVSRRTVKNRFDECFDEKPSEFVEAHRLNRALDHYQKVRSVEAVAAKFGYENPKQLRKLKEVIRNQTL